MGEKIIFQENLSVNQAIQEVIKNNKKHQYHPQRFIQMMDLSNEEKLLSKIEELIASPDESVLGTLFLQIKEKRSILTIEDLVVHFGTKWGYNEHLIGLASERVKKFDGWAGGERFKFTIEKGI